MSPLVTEFRYSVLRDLGHPPNLGEDATRTMPEPGAEQLENTLLAMQSAPLLEGKRICFRDKNYREAT